MAPKSSNKTIFVQRLGLHHFAYLRAIAEGLELSDCAKRFLGVDHGHACWAAYQQTVAAVSMMARRHGHKAWRLIGLDDCTTMRVTR